MRKKKRKKEKKRKTLCFIFGQSRSNETFCVRLVRTTTLTFTRTPIPMFNPCVFRHENQSKFEFSPHHSLPQSPTTHYQPKYNLKTNLIILKISSLTKTLISIFSFFSNWQHKSNTNHNLNILFTIQPQSSINTIQQLQFQNITTKTLNKNLIKPIFFKFHIITSKQQQQQSYLQLYQNIIN